MMSHRAIATTCATTPLATWIYANMIQQDGLNGSISLYRTRIDNSESDTYQQSSTNSILVVLNRVEYISPMMTLIRLLQSPPRDFGSLTSNERDPTTTPSTDDATQ